jgi:hypothetical protein
MGTNTANNYGIRELIYTNKELLPGCTSKRIKVKKILFFEPNFYVAFVKCISLPEGQRFGERYDSITNFVFVNMSTSQIQVVDSVYEKGPRIFPRARFGYVKVQQIWEDTVEIHYVVNPKVGIRQKFRELLLGDGQGYRVKTIKLV